MRKHSSKAEQDSQGTALFGAAMRFTWSIPVKTRASCTTTEQKPTRDR
jgi:hypothetical protein